MSKESKRERRESSPDTVDTRTDTHEEVYLYSHSGIQEKHGTIPSWLKLVVFGLLAWSVYYTIRYWSGD